MRVVKELSPSRRANLIRRWLSTFGVRMPSTRKLAALENDILVAGDDKLPRAAWDDVEVRRHGELLYCERTHSIDTSLQLEWTRDLPLALPGALGTLEAVATEQGAVAKRLPAQLQVRFRRGGEKLQLPGRSHRSYLKNLLQDACVLPWWRDRLPLIYAGGQLIAVADLWVAADFASVDEPQAICFTWHRRPDIFVQART